MNCSLGPNNKSGNGEGLTLADGDELVEAEAINLITTSCTYLVVALDGDGELEVELLDETLTEELGDKDELFEGLLEALSEILAEELGDSDRLSEELGDNEGLVDELGDNDGLTDELGDTEGLSERLTEELGEVEGLSDTLGDELTEELSEGLLEALGDELTEGLTLTDSEGETLADIDGLTDELPTEVVSNNNSVNIPGIAFESLVS